MVPKKITVVFKHRTFNSHCFKEETVSPNVISASLVMIPFVWTLHVQGGGGVPVHRLTFDFSNWI